jgi:hypothetical protein
MPKKTPSQKKSRAAYLRAYRARTAAPPASHRCPQCRTTFTVERADARYCTEACRAAAWRAITHRRLEHNPDGWVRPANEYGGGARRTCLFRFDDHTFCPQLATWLALSCRNGSHHLILLDYRCDEHCEPALRRPCHPDAACHRRGRCPLTAVTVDAAASTGSIEPIETMKTERPRAASSRTSLTVHSF